MASAEAVYGLIPSEGTGILLEIANWKTDVMTDVNFSFDMTLKVFRNGNKIAEERVFGEEQLDGSFWNPIGKSERVAVTKQKEKLDQLFASPRIRAALDSSPRLGKIEENSHFIPSPKTFQPTRSVSSSPTKELELEGCSIEQILSMKNSGLTDNQIKAACK